MLQSTYQNLKPRQGGKWGDVRVKASSFGDYKNKKFATEALKALYVSDMLSLTPALVERDPLKAGDRAKAIEMTKKLIREKHCPKEAEEIFAKAFEEAVKEATTI